MNHLAIILALLAATSAMGQAAKPSKTAIRAKLRAFMDEAVERRLFRGALVVVESGSVVFEFAAGDAEDGTQATTVDSSFYLASLSKQFTATAVMLLKEQGHLSFDDPVSKHLSGLPDWADEVTVRHLLTNTSGLGNYLESERASDEGMSNDEAMEYIRTSDRPAFPPGQEYLYSNSGYMLLARMVEQISQISFRDFNTKHIFQPLGMSAVFYDETRPTIPDRVRGYDRFGQLRDLPHVTNGAGGMFGSARDLVRWHEAIFDAKLLDQATLDEAFTPMTLNDGTQHPYGFGWHIHDLESGKALHHTGSLVGFRHFMFADLARRNVVIMLTNGGDAFPLPEMATGVTEILRGRPATVPKPSLVDHLFHYAKDHPQELRAEAKRAREDEPDRFRINEGALNMLGYAFLEMNRLTEAIGIFEAVVDAFPGSANAYDSYGEALMEANRYEEAVANYQRSLELDPSNDNANVMLQRLEMLMSR